MQTVSWKNIDQAEAADVGKIALYAMGCNPLAIEDTLEECIAVASDCIGEPVETDDIDDRTDLVYLCSGDLVAVIVGE